MGSSRHLALVAVCLAVVWIGAGCGSQNRVVKLQFTSVGTSRFAGTTLVVRSGPRLKRLVSLLADRLPASTQRLPGEGACEKLLLNVSLSNHQSFSYGPCVYPEVVRPLLRTMCREFYAGSPALVLRCARL
jgi:hypothetical protein